MRTEWIMTIAVFIIITGAFGCGGKMPDEAASTSNMTAQRYDHLQRLAAKRIDCAKQDLVYSYLEDNRHALSGCGRTTEFVLICLGTRCRWAPPPVAQASFDLDCAVENLEIIPIHDQKIGVAGCGRRASYGWICQGALSCDWYKDGIDGARSEAAVAAEKAALAKAHEATNRTKRQARSFGDEARTSANRGTMQSGMAHGAANGGR